MEIIAVANQKRGVGKTTVSVNASAAMARLGMKVLLLDIDPQANASTTLGKIDPYEAKFTAASVFLDKTIYASPWYESNEENVSLIYGHVSLTRVERDLPRIHPTTPGMILKKRISTMATDDFDVLVIDCPPSLSMLTVNALVAAKHLIVPMESGSKYSLDGYADLQELVQDVRDEANPDLNLAGVLIVKHDGRKNNCKAMRTVIEKRFGEKVFPIAISAGVRIQEAEAAKQSVFQYDRQCTGSRDFMELGRQILERIGLKPREEEPTLTSV